MGRVEGEWMTVVSVRGMHFCLHGYSWNSCDSIDPRRENEFPVLASNVICCTLY